MQGIGTTANRSPAKEQQPDGLFLTVSKIDTTMDKRLISLIFLQIAEPSWAKMSIIPTVRWQLALRHDADRPTLES